MTGAEPALSRPHAGPPMSPRDVPSRRVRILRFIAMGLAAFLIAPYYATCLYLLIDPPFSALMLRQTLKGKSFHQEWRNLDEISPNLVIQVIASEDGHFCEHWGVDLGALKMAFDAAAEGKPRGGGSTISMQAAKNLFFWNRPALLRKPLELPLALYMDFVLGKRRLLEIYLNIVEWAPGVFGAEAAARHHFGKSAAELTPQEAAQLAAALPAPYRRDAGRPGPRTFALANRLRARAMRMRAAAFCVLD